MTRVNESNYSGGILQSNGHLKCQEENPNRMDRLGKNSGVLYNRKIPKVKLSGQWRDQH